MPATCKYVLLNACNLLFALGIRFVGETVAKKLAKSFKDLDEMANANLETLTSIDEIGVKILRIGWTLRQ